MVSVAGQRLDPAGPALPAAHGLRAEGAVVFSQQTAFVKGPLMSLLSKLWPAGVSSGTTKPRRPVRLGVEPLEDRAVPAVFVVQTLADAGAGSLRQAVLAANARPGADVIRFAGPVRGTITLSGELPVTGDLVVDGPGIDRLTVSGDGVTRVFAVSGPDTDATIRHLTVADGRATGGTLPGQVGPVTLGGGLVNLGGRVSLAHVRFADNVAAGHVVLGGAVANVLGGTLSVADCEFRGNRTAAVSTGRGGAIANDGGSSVTIDRTTFTRNTVTTELGWVPANSQGIARGGAVSNAGGSTASVLNSAFVGNVARGGDGADGAAGRNGVAAGRGVGGGVVNDIVSILVPFASSVMSVDGCYFLDNQALGGTGGAGGDGANGGSDGGRGSLGGAVVNGASHLTVSRSAFVGNQVVGGRGGKGGVGGTGGSGGSAPGGAIASASPPPDNTGGVKVRAFQQVSGCLFLNNTATGGAGGDAGAGGRGGNGGVGEGGAIGAVNLIDWTVTGCVFVGNRAVGGEGGDRGDGLASGLSGAGQGGGISSTAGSVGTIDGSVFLQNQAVGGAGRTGADGGAGRGGAIFHGGPSGDGPPTLTVSDTLVSLNRADGGAAGDGGRAGAGQGGGGYLTAGGTAFARPRTFIFLNTAATDGDDVFGEFNDLP